MGFSRAVDYNVAAFFSTLLILAAPGIEMADKRRVLLALTLYARQNVDFVDALLSVHMQRAGVPDLVSYDKHFDRLPGVRRQTPEAFLAG